MTETEDTILYLDKICYKTVTDALWEVILDQTPTGGSAVLVWRRGDQFSFGGKKFVNGFKLLEELGEDPTIAIKLAEPMK